ncbi:hypothetical protein SAMN05421857_2413, partial [Chryseobacterium formosense]
MNNRNSNNRNSRNSSSQNSSLLEEIYQLGYDHGYTDA